MEVKGVDMMDLNITPELYENISEIYETGNQSVKVVTNDGRTVKVTACKILRGPTVNYIADYEQLVCQEVNGQSIRIWSQASYPSAYSETAEKCIRYAMGFVDSQRLYY